MSTPEEWIARAANAEYLRAKWIGAGLGFLAGSLALAVAWVAFGC